MKIQRPCWSIYRIAASHFSDLTDAARSGNPARCRATATVQAIVHRNRESSEPQYLDGYRCDSWEVVVPELVFER